MKILVGNKMHLEIAIRALRKKAKKYGLIIEAKRRGAFENKARKKERKHKENMDARKRLRTGNF